MSARNQVSSVRLEYYSLRFAKKLFKQFPQWKPYSGYRAVEENGFPTYYLDMSVPSANPKVEEPLRIMTYPQEAIVQWAGGAHSHFDDYRDSAPLAYMEAALDFVERIVSDKIIFGYYVKDRKPTGAGFWCDADSDTASRWKTTKHGDVIIRSWHGAQDCELHVSTS